MRAIIFSAAISIFAFSSLAEAAFSKCGFQETPCNDKGDHFFCYQYGWGNGEYCSPVDTSHGPGFRAAQYSHPIKDCRDTGCPADQACRPATSYLFACFKNAENDLHQALSSGEVSSGPTPDPECMQNCRARFPHANDMSCLTICIIQKDGW